MTDGQVLGLAAVCQVKAAPLPRALQVPRVKPHAGNCSWSPFLLQAQAPMRAAGQSGRRSRIPRPQGGAPRSGSWRGGGGMHAVQRRG